MAGRLAGKVAVHRWLDEVGGRHGRIDVLCRVGEAAEVVRGALFLASDEASYVTGANLMVDGGWSAVLPGA